MRTHDSCHVFVCVGFDRYVYRDEVLMLVLTGNLMCVATDSGVDGCACLHVYRCMYILPRWYIHTCIHTYLQIFLCLCVRSHACMYVCSHGNM